MREGLIREIEQFLYREARLLDDRRFQDWLALFTDDIHYWMAARNNRYPKASKAVRISHPDSYDEDDLPKANELAILDEDRDTLTRRIARLETGMAWSEDPPSRTRHLVNNIEVAAGDSKSELKVYSNFLVYQNRRETERNFYVGSRRDILRRVRKSWKIANRRVILDQNVLLAKNVTTFF
jgi:3-phenylpropionate/cinnamic acid dioxygenase small subunit